MVYFSIKDIDNPSVSNIKYITIKLKWQSTFTFNYLHV